MKNDEYIKDKMALKENIAKLINDFNKKYDVMVSYIDFDYFDSCCGYGYIKVNIETKL